MHSSMSTSSFYIMSFAVIFTLSIITSFMYPEMTCSLGVLSICALYRLLDSVQEMAAQVLSGESSVASCREEAGLCSGSCGASRSDFAAVVKEQAGRI